MGQVVLYLAISVDGYLADEQSGVDWLSGDRMPPAVIRHFWIR